MRILICANTVSVVYQVNGGEEVSLDFRTITTQGISGVHELIAGQALELMVASEHSTLILTLARGNDVSRSTILDRYIIPIQ